MSIFNVSLSPIFTLLLLSLFTFSTLQAQDTNDKDDPDQEEPQPQPIECDFVVFNTVYPEATCIYAPDAATAVKLYETVHLVRFANSLGYFCDFSNCTDGQTCDLYFFGWRPGHTNWHPEPTLDSLIPNKWHFPKIYRHTAFACNDCHSFQGEDPSNHESHLNDPDHFSENPLETLMGDGLLVSPNPAANWLKVDIELQEAANQCLLQVQDVNGQILIKQSYSTLAKGLHQEQLDISQLPNGTYYISIIRDQQRASISSFVIQR